MHRATLVLTLVPLVALAAPTKKAMTQPTYTSGATVEGISEYFLPNGLQVLLFPDGSKQTVTVNITYFVGSRHEGYGETGMAHLLEHLVFKGTPKTPNVPQALTDHGARPNGTTWFDRTNYFETVPATDQNLEWALRFEADRMVNSFIAKKDLDSEMTVVRNELERGENEPKSVLLDRVMSTAFLWHNYGKSTIGARSDVENVPIERLQDFYRRYYQPDNAMLVVAGRFEPKKALDIIADSFGKLPRPTRKLIPTYTAEPTQDGERTVTVRRVGGTPYLAAAYHVPAVSHPDFAAVQVLVQVLGDSPSGRLYKALVEPKKAASVSAWAWALREPGAAMFTAELKKEDAIPPAQDALLATLDKAAGSTFSAEEVDRAKATLLKQIELLLNSSERVGLRLSEAAAAGDWRLLFLSRDRLRAVTPADVQKVASAYWKPSNRTYGLFVPTEKPERAEVPAAPDVASLVKDYKGDAPLAQGEVFDPSPKNIEARTVRAQVDGLKLALLSKKTRGETVNAFLTLRLGNEKALENRGTDGELAGSMLMRGTQKHTRQQLKDELDQLKASVAVSGGPTLVTVRVEARRPALMRVLELVSEVLRTPAFDAKELEELRAEHLAYYQQQKDDPQALASLELQRRTDPWPASHPFYVKTFDERIAALKAVKAEQLRDFHGKFYGASGELAAVGDFDTAEVQKKVEALFGGWKSREAVVRIPRPHRAVPAADLVINTPDKSNATYLGAITFALRDDHTDAPALTLSNFLLGGGFLNSRLATRLRQKEGLSYGVWSYLSASSLDESATFGFGAIHAPENVGRVDSGAKEELTRALKDGFTADEVSRGKQGFLQQREQSRARDDELARRLASWLFVGRTLAFDETEEKKIAALSPDELKGALGRWIDPAKSVVVKAGDFTKKAPATEEK